MMKKMMGNMMPNGGTSPPTPKDVTDDHSAHHPGTPPANGGN